MKKNIISLLICIMLSAAMIMPCMAAAEYDSTEVSRFVHFWSRRMLTGLKTGQRLARLMTQTILRLGAGSLLPRMAKLSKLYGKAKQFVVTFS